MITANPVLANGIAGLATSATAQATVQVRHATASHLEHSHFGNLLAAQTPYGGLLHTLLCIWLCHPPLLLRRTYTCVSGLLCG